MTFTSAIIASGGDALTDVTLPNPLMDANGDAIPSCDAAVGTLMKGTFVLEETNFAASIAFPPPNPTSTVGLNSVM